MIDDLLLLSGNDIPFPEAQLTIHQPTVKEVAYVGEENFFTGYQILNISKNLFNEEDKTSLEDQSNFDILIAILRERNAVMQKNRNCVLMLLAIMFPKYAIKLKENCIELDEEIDGEIKAHKIDNSNFESFQMIIKKMFSFTGEQDDAVNPSGDMAKKIAEKLKKRHQKLAEQAGDIQKVDVISRYSSILAIGTEIDLNTILNYSVYQLFDQFQRYQLKMGYEMYVKAKMAGAKDLEEVEDWMKDIHS